jgi:hypothetical protein
MTKWAISALPILEPNLFPYLFEFRFYLDDQMGHFGVADLGTHGVKFPIQLLQQKI